MDFARRILQNYGWRDGDGLGKNKDGMVKPLRATLKFDTAGFGADQSSSDFNNHWWERVFNEAATNVSITKAGEQVKVALKDDENSVEISTKGYSVNKLKKLKEMRRKTESKSDYDNFLQASILTNVGNEVENFDKIDANEIEVSNIKVLTDEELFKACGGRTAHKGARHGLKSIGKLARIERQNNKLSAEIMAKRVSFSKDKESKNNFETNITIPEYTEGQYAEQRKNEGNADDDTHKRRKMFCAENSKTKKNKHKQCKEEIVTHHEIGVIETKKRKCSNKKHEVFETIDEQTLNNDISEKDNVKKKSKKRKNEKVMEEEVVHNIRKKKNKPDAF